MESEFIALELDGSEAEWLRNLLANISLGINPTPSVSMHCDCKLAIAVAKNKSFNVKNRHIQLRHNMVKQLLKDGTILIGYVRSKVNLVEPMTKPLGRKTICDTSKEMGLKAIRN